MAERGAKKSRSFAGAKKSRSFAGAEKKDYGSFFPGVRRHQKIANVGVSVFVNFVSKRIHKATLRDAFSEYGKVIGTYIAYHNVKRIKNKHTFAFVRFASRDDTERAVERGNNRRMDGFYIKVFLEKKHTRTVGTDVELPACGPKALPNMVSPKTNIRQSEGIDLSRMFY
ncbi:hypothetical protein V6N12_048481 [Hibiscus sabdariffa]|uniref:RRM domain-containing protein n=1 Tax=Hibiscus sabdariffa TaxID=183260 RepID=A0ABR2EJ56_9ROSI